MSEGIIIAIIGGIISLLVAIVPKIIEAKSGLTKKVEKLTAEVESIKKVQTEQGDIMYQMLDHMVTNNNSGRMKKCLDDYNSFNRHN